MIEIKPHAEGCVLSVHAQPGAKRNAIVGVHGVALKVAVTAPADKGRANAAIIEVLAHALDLKRNQIDIVAGLTARAKQVLIRGKSVDVLRDRLQTHEVKH